VTLVQKKHGDFDYEYMAVRRFTNGKARWSGVYFGSFLFLSNYTLSILC
jgi:hypothetical protein